MTGGFDLDEEMISPNPLDEDAYCMSEMVYREVRRRAGRWEVKKSGSKDVKKRVKQGGRKGGRCWRDRRWWAPSAVHLN